MAFPIQELKKLNEYMNGVVERADHHGHNVNEIALTLVGAVIWKATDIEVREIIGRTGNVLWFHIGDHRYALAYQHETGNIELRDRSQQGAVLAEFNNQTTTLQVKQLFAAL